ncbi:MAG: hypothetical protein HQL50_12950 [Magnetococcales bacterium]|nr:hypothetical protein [Magnetococcales bacterium]
MYKPPERSLFDHTPAKHAPSALTPRNEEPMESALKQEAPQYQTKSERIPNRGVILTLGKLFGGFVGLSAAFKYQDGFHLFWGTPLFILLGMYLAGQLVEEVLHIEEEW